MQPVTSQRPWERIEWSAPDRNLPQTALELIVAPSSRLRSLVAEGGEPTVRAASPLDTAKTLLRAAAEIEHAFLVQYLYAAWSLGTTPAARTVVQVAVQEMCHFITVQNLLLSLGDTPSVSRQDQYPSPPIDPFPFALRPASRTSLEDFLLAEMPALDEMDAAKRATMQPIVDQRLQQGGTIVNRVGLIYAKLYWLFQPDDNPTADWPDVAKAGFEPGHIASLPGLASATTLQADPQTEREWNAGADEGGVFASVRTRDDALGALFQIAVQGEGSAAATSDSHFDMFLNIYRSPGLDALLPINCPTNPSDGAVQLTDPAQEANRITNPVAAALSRVFSSRYRILLACIRAALASNRSLAASLASRSRYLSWAFQEMLSNVNALASSLARLPCKLNGDAQSLRAAPCFGLTGFSLPAGTDWEEVLLSLHREAGIAIAAALQQPLGAGVKFLISQIQSNDRRRFPSL